MRVYYEMEVLCAVLVITYADAACCVMRVACCMCVALRCVALRCVALRCVASFVACYVVVVSNVQCIQCNVYSVMYMHARSNIIVICYF